jgi:hypothetical protein
MRFKLIQLCTNKSKDIAFSPVGNTLVQYVLIEVIPHQEKKKKIGSYSVSFAS